MEAKEISKAVIKRLPRYYRYLGELMEENVERISSNDLSKKMHVTASQIRQDLNNFGGFGQQGYGYNVETLQNAVGEILGINSGHRTIIVGVGYLGHALANYRSFEKRGFHLIGAFDSDPDVVGNVVNGIRVMPMDDLEKFISSRKAAIAILTVPKSAADKVVEELVECGIKGILNFTYTDIAVPDNVCIENVHPSDALMTLSYKMKEKKEGQ